MAQSKRLANVELLRIFNMLMVVGIHYIRESGSLLTEQTATLTVTHVVAMLLEAFFIVMIDTYVFISGYYGLESRFKPSKLISFLCRIWFYSLLIPLVLSLFGIPTLAKSQGIYGIAQYLFPIGNEHYWFMTAYFYLMLFMPFINTAVKSMSKNQVVGITACFLIVFCGVKSIVPLPFALDKGGYELIWLICVYLLAVCFRLHGGKVEAWFRRHCRKIYPGSCFISFGLMLGIWMLLPRFSGLTYYFGVPLHHNFIFCLTGAIGLFYTFLSIRIPEGKLAECIRFLSKYSLGVYLIHEHLDLRTLWCPALTGWMKPFLENELAFFAAGLLFCVVVVFTAGVAVDFIREKIFGFFYRFLQNTPVVRGIRKLDDSMTKKEG